MKRVETLTDLELALPIDGQIGFIPTMGALHDGHLSLVAKAKKEKMFAVASIFVNPTQFNDPKDFQKYPRDTEADIAKLNSAGCDLVFLPHEDEIYNEGLTADKYLHDFGFLESRLEGAFRPDHFKGVAQIVHILLEAVAPDYAFFGEKDFQQLQVIRALVKKASLNVEVIGMPTIREPDGLAMSSRNRRLSDDARAESPALYQCLSHAKTHLSNKGIEAIKTEVKNMIEATDTLRLEYFDMVDPDTFESVTDSHPKHNVRALIAAYAGDVRLIDNLKLA
ncbi:MAG: pantoate--beta-alanine ligase [Salibacteraceae bacterium]